MSGLLDFVQGASNAAAGTVAGPIDLINMGLLGVGLPMPNNPFGGSQWMRERGLMRDPENRTAGLLGESVGGILPIVAAARAPQIAAGLLQAGDNLRAPTPFNAATRGQGGAIVYHGSPHRFDKFDSSKIGTGEGAQAYGHGLYFAESPGVAKSYRAKLNDLPITSVKADLYEIAGDPQWSIKAFDANGKLIPKVKGFLSPAEIEKHYGKEVADLVLGSKYGGHFKNLNIQEGALYKVDLPDEHIARMLDWDKPWSQQPEAVRVAAMDLGLPQSATGKDVYNALATQARDVAISRGNSAATTLGASQAAASNDLIGFGIPGVRYLDGGSRTAGGGTSNYVVFPGNENLLTILGRE
jgi:hypothetical protein